MAASKQNVLSANKCYELEKPEELGKNCFHVENTERAVSGTESPQAGSPRLARDARGEISWSPPAFTFVILETWRPWGKGVSVPVLLGGKRFKRCALGKCETAKPSQ